MEKLVFQYLATAMWSSNVDGVSALEIPSLIHRRAEEYLSHILAEAKKQGMDIHSDDMEQFAHDLWLTHEGHGAGFWDGYWDTLRVDADPDEEWEDKLTALAAKFPPTIQCIHLDEGEDLPPVEDIFEFNCQVIDGVVKEVRYKI